MVVLPEWVPNWLMYTVGVYSAQFFFVLSSSAPDITGNAFQIIARAIVFNIDGIHPLFQAFLIFTIPVPAFLLLASYAFQAFNNAISGIIVGIAGLLTLLIGLID